MHNQAAKKTKTRNKTIQKAKEKRKFFKYTDDQLKSALKEIRENGMKIREASRISDVPKTTIQDYLRGRIPKVARRTGPEPLLTVSVEEKIATWTLNLAKCGFPIKKDDLLSTVEMILKTTNNQKLFKNGKPGQKWYTNFLKRHPEISLREAEGINKARATVTEESIRLWFRELEKFLHDNNLSEILGHPNRIFNGDESGFALCPKTGKVLAPKGWKNLYQIKTSQEKENITVLIVFNASGDICPPLVVFPYIRPPRAVVDSMPPDWVLGKSDSGWMRSNIFYEYIANSFHKWILENEIPKPVLVFVDGHKSHMTMALSEFCENHGIILYALPPNTTHILQPADVSVFKPLKTEWKITVRHWINQQKDLNNCSVTKTNFCQLFAECLANVQMKSHIANGFRKCGLFPFNPNNVDYTKCVKNILEKQQTIRETQHEDPITINDIKATEKVLQKIRAPLTSYGINVDVIFNEIQPLNLPTLSVEQEITDVVEYQAADECDAMSMDTLVGRIVPMNSVTIIPTNDIILVSGDEKISSSQNNNLYETEQDLELGTTEFLPKSDASPGVDNDSFSQHLIYPEPIQWKKKTSTDKTPSAISSEAWRKHYELKDKLKLDKAKDIERRRQKRITAKEKKHSENEKTKRKRSKAAKKTVLEAVDETNATHSDDNTNKIKCASCEEELQSDTEMEDEKNIGCDKCSNWFHMKCTEFCGMLYEEAAAQDYICFRCS